MATVPSITVIPNTECIGNSLVTINTNYSNIKNSFNSVNSDLTIVNNTLNTLTTFANNISGAQLSKGWVKFNPRRDENSNPIINNTNREILNSYNIDYVVREDTGKYLINLQVPIGSEFVVTGTVSPQPPGTGTASIGVLNLDPSVPFPAPGNTSCRVIVQNLEGASIDPSLVCLTFFSY